jgi:hypothetical protein
MEFTHEHVDFVSTLHQSCLRSFPLLHCSPTCLCLSLSVSVCLCLSLLVSVCLCLPCLPCHAVPAPSVILLPPPSLLSPSPTRPKTRLCQDCLPESLQGKQLRSCAQKGTREAKGGVLYTPRRLGGAWPTE